MPRYFFHVSANEAFESDPTGFEVRDLETALEQVLELARELWAEAILNGDDLSDHVVIITDEAGRTLATVPFTSALPPGLRRKLR
jgi:hypothetical protein